MRRYVAALFLLAGCAPAAQGPLQTPTGAPPRVEETSSGYDIRLDPSGRPTSTSFDVAVDKLWPVAMQAYTKLGLKADRVDAVRHQVAGRLVVRRQLNGRPLSEFVDCGHEISGSIADTWRLTIDSQMAVGPGTTAASSVLGSMLTVRATPVEGTSTTLTQCASRGALETLLAQNIRTLLAQ